MSWTFFDPGWTIYPPGPIPEEVCPMETNELRAWMAGFVDGEGSITLSKQLRKGRPSPRYLPMITISNTVRALLEPFQNQYGGIINEIHQKRRMKDSTRYAMTFTWYCPQNKAVPFINDILPYLVSKRLQAKAVLEFMYNKKAWRQKRISRGYRGGSSPLTDEEIQYREALWLRVHELNKRGENPTKYTSLAERLLQ